MVISFINQKGGVGKTTSAINVGFFLAQKGKKVLLLDIDPQSNLTSGVGFQGEKKERNGIYEVLNRKSKISDSFYSTSSKNLYLIPAHIKLAGAEIELVGALSRETILKNQIAEIKDQFDYILIDCPPSLGLLTINALTASDYALIPVQCEYFALEGLGQLVNTINLIKKNLNPSLSIGGVIMTMFDTRTKLSKEVVDEVRRVFKSKVFETIVPRNVRLSEAPSHGKPIEVYAPKSSGAKAYDKLTDEILKNL